MVIFNTFFRITFLYILQTINFLYEDTYLLYVLIFLKPIQRFQLSKDYSQFLVIYLMMKKCE